MKTVRSKDGTSIVYDIQDSGPKMIYITGAICFREFGPVKKDVSEFAKAFTVVSYDRRGRGDSGDTLPYSPAREPTSESERKKNDQFCDELESLLEQKLNAQAIKHFLSSIGMPKLFRWLLPLFPGWSKMKALAPTLMYDMKLTRDVPPVDRAKNLKVPALIMYGSKSTYGFNDVSESLAQASANIKVETFKDQDHMIAAKLLRPRLEMFFSSRYKAEPA